MIKRKSEMTSETQVKMRGGDGSAVITRVLNADEYNANARLMGTITLNPSSSIGEHVHENEEEMFYIISGTAIYNDNGEEVILNEGDSCICLGGQKHSIKNASDEEKLTFFATIINY